LRNDFQVSSTGSSEEKPNPWAWASGIILAFCNKSAIYVLELAGGSYIATMPELTTLMSPGPTLSRSMLLAVASSLVGAPNTCKLITFNKLELVSVTCFSLLTPS